MPGVRNNDGEATEKGGIQLESEKKSTVSTLLDYAGSYRHLTYLGLGLSAVAMILGMLPYICIWLVLRDLIAVAPDWTQAAAITRCGWAAFVSTFAALPSISPP